jgi:hypothetical protein
MKLPDLLRWILAGLLLLTAAGIAYTTTMPERHDQNPPRRR